MAYTVTSSIVIDGPPGDVFAALADPAVQITYDRETYIATEQLTPGPIGKGTRFRGTFKGMGTVEYEYDEFEPGRLIQHHFVMSVGDTHHRFEFSPESGGTRLTQTIDTEPSLFGRVVWPLLLERKLRARMRTLNTLVRTYVEASPPHPPS
ncbi:MAG: SRPBCC family protein [bacterium]